MLEEVGALYDAYGRGHEGMMLPYVTRCFRSFVQRAAEPRATRDPAEFVGEPTQPLNRADLPGGPPPKPQPPDYDDDGIRLIDFS